MERKVDMEKIVSLAKRRGFVFQGSEIYGGLANTWDYGPYGSLLKKNIKDFWWNSFVQKRQDIVGLDAAILMNPKTWVASGHVASFSDPLMDCLKCKERIRGDKLIEENLGIEAAAGKSLEQVSQIIKENNLKCPKCGETDFTEARSFNLMFETHQGVIKDEGALVYMRPETAQGIFVNFKNVQQTSRKKVPFGIAQIGKAFRNEITPGNFIFRTREFEQMEIEYFIKPGTEKEIFAQWKEDVQNWFLSLGVKKDHLRFREHEKDELSHYSSMTFDVEYLFPFGGKKGEVWGELMGLAYRGCYDLTQHQEHSGKDMSYLDPETNEKYIPHVIEPSFGMDRTVLTVLLDAYDEDTVDGDERVVMRFKPSIAPIKAAILPLMKKDGLAEKAQEIVDKLSEKYMVDYDESGSIGKRYRRQDEIGTPFAFTVDYDTMEDGTVTMRDRDTTEQTRMKIEDIDKFLAEKLV